MKAGALIRRRKLEDCRLLMQFIQSVVDVSVCAYVLNGSMYMHIHIYVHICCIGTCTYIL